MINQHHFTQIQQSCLNGWWDFLPNYGNTPLDDVDQPPMHDDKAWLREQLMVPSYWNKSRLGVRQKGEALYRDGSEDTDPWDNENEEHLFDAYGYPQEWSKAKGGWLQRTLKLDTKAVDQRYFLLFEAILPQSILFVNGKRVQTHRDAMLPLEADVSEYLQQGNNIITVYVADYDTTEDGRTLTPSGHEFTTRSYFGIWQDVFLIQRPEVYLKDQTIQTSVRENKLSLESTIINASKQEQHLQVRFRVCPWDTEQGHYTPERCELELAPLEITLAPGESQSFRSEQAWHDAKLWSPEQPQLYAIETALKTHQGLEELTLERFGFREVWIEGKHLMMNGYPLHLFSDWGHKPTPYQHTEAFIRKWFGMIKDGNMNHSRLHSHPHPQLTLDLADELGILITDETAIFGCGANQAGDDPRYWENAKEHCRMLVQRDKNHPSLILYSVENEFRWSRDETNLAQQELPKLRATFHQLDPTRYAYHDGDSSLWDERNQDIISRHYGRENAGMGWWDQKQPLFSSECSLYHYLAAPCVAELGGDRVYEDYGLQDEMAGLDSKLVIEAGRTLGVACWGPWNQSCLANLRPYSEDVTLSYDDFSAPGVKPLKVPAHSAEFEFWKEGKGYHPMKSFFLQTDAFRPLALIDTQQKSQFYAGSEFNRTLHLVNDSSSTVQGSVQLSIQTASGEVLCQAQQELKVDRGQVGQVQFSLKLPIFQSREEVQYHAEFKTQDEKNGDAWSRGLEIHPPLELMAPTLSDNIYVYGDSPIKQLLEDWKLNVFSLTSFDFTKLAPNAIVVLGNDCIIPDADQVQPLRNFIQKGGRVLLLEQSYSIFGDSKLVDMKVLHAHMRISTHPCLKGIRPSALSYWGDDAYPVLENNAYLATKLYSKTNGSSFEPILDATFADFANGTMAQSPLMCSEDGSGIIIASQLRISSCYPNVPAAAQLLANALEHLGSFQSKTDSSELIELNADQTKDIQEKLKEVESGKTLVVHGLNPNTVSIWNQAIGCSLEFLDVGEIYQSVKTSNERWAPEIQGINNQDLCCIDAWQYGWKPKPSRQVAQHALAPQEQLRALLVTPTQSAIREMYIYGAKREALRVNTATRFIWGKEKPQEAILLAEMKVGKGRILFNQIDDNASTDYPQVRFYRDRLLQNLGASKGASLLNSDRVPAPEGQGCGYPRELFVLEEELNSSSLKQFIADSEPIHDRATSKRVMNTGTWTQHGNELGQWSAVDLGARTPITLYHILNSPCERNQESGLSDDGFPNPGALTFLDCKGNGQVELYINGQSYGKLGLDSENSPVAFADISLEQGANHILILWTPEDDQSQLSLLWRNIMHHTETTFGF